MHIILQSRDARRHPGPRWPHPAGRLPGLRERGGDAHHQPLASARHPAEDAHGASGTGKVFSNLGSERARALVPPSDDIRSYRYIYLGRAHFSSKLFPIRAVPVPYRIAEISKRPIARCRK